MKRKSQPEMTNRHTIVWSVGRAESNREQMNEETEQLDGTLQTIGGDVYDLTNGKVSIMLDPD